MEGKIGSFQYYMVIVRLLLLHWKFPDAICNVRQTEVYYISSERQITGFNPFAVSVSL